ncbi:hypothetical protein DXG01_016308 [Tephrocybe rancida]|nr:hypothetical protein DXG01_016308 [Tephrocybe rancida]
MPPKRKRRVSPSSKGLAPGQQLKRSVLPNNSSSHWAWVGTEVALASEITPEHLLISCGLSKRNKHPFCQNKYSPKQAVKPQPSQSVKAAPVGGELDDDIIIISDDEGPSCSSKNCKSNPNCLNHLGQEDWEDEDDAYGAFMKALAMDDNPALDTREPNFPVGLKDSPIFQLQVTFAALQESIQNCFNPVKLVESLQLRTTEQQDAQEFSKLFMSHLDAEFKKQANPKVKSLVTDQNNAKLEDRIDALLQPETLTGDNNLQDATRYTELKELPPVLHFSLLRFVYDLATMERKKSKHSVSFPTTLDMTPFIGARGDSSVGLQACGANTYELRGILLHKGSSAYHGHYEAQVFDEANESWYQFNDETVTKIKTLREAPRKPIVIDDDSDENSQSRGHRSKARKRPQLESEDENDPLPISKKLPEYANTSSVDEYISSKDAYMLIYTRKVNPVIHSSKNGGTRLDTPTPPPDALEVVNALNAAHDETCESYDKKERLIKARFHERRSRVVDIYRSWNVDSFDAPVGEYQDFPKDSVLVSRQALSVWLSQHQDKLASTISTDDPDGKNIGKQTTLEDIVCVHGGVDPNKANNIKRLKRSAYLDIVKDTGWDFNPHLTASDICFECVQRSFQERLYQIEHPRSVAYFDRVSEVAFDCIGFWISKPWVRDWRLTKPKMHTVSEGDPAPDSADFASDVLCEHGALSLNATSRRKISAEAAELLQNLYPSWDPLSTKSELCPVCDANVHISKESKREIRKQAEDEKAKLKNLHEHFFCEEALIADDALCALVSTNFAKAWKKWLDRPTECPRPERLDNTHFMCEHDMLVFDPNIPSDLESCALLILQSDWDLLESLKTVWTSTQIIIRLGGTKPKAREVKDSEKGATYTSSGARQSRRLRQLKELGEKRRFTISKSTTVKEIKVMVQEELEIPTICQRLFHNDKELNDNTASVDSIGILAHDVLDLRRENEVVDLDSDLEEEKRPRDEERGFHGTLLGRSTSPPPNDDTGGEKSCRACTFSNVVDALSCTVCDTSFT